MHTGGRKKTPLRLFFEKFSKNAIQHQKWGTHRTYFICFLQPQNFELLRFLCRQFNNNLKFKIK